MTTTVLEVKNLQDLSPLECVDALTSEMEIQSDIDPEWSLQVSLSHKVFPVFHHVLKKGAEKNIRPEDHNDLLQTMNRLWLSALLSPRIVLMVPPDMVKDMARDLRTGLNLVWNGNMTLPKFDMPNIQTLLMKLHNDTSDSN